MADKKFRSAFEYKVLYIFDVPNDEKYNGLIKIGDATVHTDNTPDKLPPNCRELNHAAKDRINTYTGTAGVTYRLLHTELAVRSIKNDDGTTTLKAFRDKDVHRVLANSGIKHKKLGSSTEFFELDLQTALKAVDAVKQGKANLSGTGATVFSPIILRPEQEEAVSKTCKQFKKGDRMLWNAKMRFGKTVCALEVVKRMGFKRSIIITHRPVVNAGWYEDFGHIFHDRQDVRYGSKTNGYTVSELIKDGTPFVYFASIQDLRGSTLVGGKFDKNDDIFRTNWDCVIVDEAHEGTQTTLGDEVIKAIMKESSGYTTKFLALSGTPFNILGDFDDESIYTWDYIMEQESKVQWDLGHFGDSNPYDELPELRIYTYDLGNILPKNKSYISFEDKAFNFREFFRTWTGDYSVDYAQMPEDAKVGDFVHEQDIRSFLELMTKEDEESCYPFSNEEYRSLFRHTLWMVPGVKEAKALKAVMMKHPVFGSGAFNIVNVAGAGDEEDDNALAAVKKAIKEANKLHEYTITLSCGKLTTGVTVREWTGVFMLAGSFSTSAANYLQTIFRVQSPCKDDDGKVKDVSYVFDFAPDRTLKMVATAVSVSSRAGKTSNNDRQALGKFLNYCPVISISGSEMKEYSTAKLLQQLKRAYAERVVQSGFDDVTLYNDELLKLDQIDIEKFNKLKGIIGKTPASPKTNEIDINAQGLTQEEYEEKEKLEKKPKRQLTEEEKERLKELKEKRALRNDAISILRGISIRMPLLIFGADIPYDEDITLNKFVDLVDNSSWEEFMPVGITKAIFRQFQKYYDEEVFVAAGRRIRTVTKDSDEVDPTERVKKIADLFSFFKNPDKETVLTPWRVVNMHMSDCLGGWDFWDEKHEHTIEQPRFVDQGQVTKDVFGNLETKILEINSKTGLYPLYVTYGAYRRKLEEFEDGELNLGNRQELWNQTVEENIYVVCKTPMAKAITRRTLVGYSGTKVNAHYFDDLLNVMANKPQQFVDKVLKAGYWKQKGSKMHFNAIVSNPPYQSTTQGGSASGHAARQATPVFNLFVEQAKNIDPDYMSMIIPARWYNGGMGLKQFRENMINDRRIVKLVDYINAKDCFPTVDIAGGLCYFLWKNGADEDCVVTNITAGREITLRRALNKYDSLFVRYNESIPIIDKVRSQTEHFMDETVSAIDTFGIPSKEKGHENYQPGDLKLLHSVGANSQGMSYISPDKVTKGKDLIEKYKVKISIMVPQNGEVGVRPENGYRSISTPYILYPGEVDTFSYLNIGFFDTEEEARNFKAFMECKFPRFLMRNTYSSVHISQSNFIFVPVLDMHIKWTDKTLYEKYGLTEQEIELVENMMRVM